MMAGGNPRYNASGCADPTAYEALSPIIKEEAELDKTVYDAIKAIKIIISLAGLELVDRVQVRHKKSGKEFR